jgi:hypothetical protein
VAQQDTYQYVAAHILRERRQTQPSLRGTSQRCKTLLWMHGTLNQRLSRILDRFPISGQCAIVYGCKKSETNPRNGYNLTTTSHQKKSIERSKSGPKNGRYPIFQPQYQDHELRRREDHPQRTKHAPMRQEPTKGEPKAKRGEAPQLKRNRAHKIDHQWGLHRLHHAHDNYHYTPRKKCTWKKQVQGHRKVFRRKNEGQEPRRFLRLEK